LIWGWGRGTSEPLRGDLCAQVFPVAAEGTTVNTPLGGIMYSRRCHRHFNRYLGIVEMEVVIPISVLNGLQYNSTD